MFRAGVAHPVERHLAKVEVASSSLVARSIKNRPHFVWSVFYYAATMARKIKSQHPGGVLLTGGLDGGDTTIFVPMGTKMQTSLVARSTTKKRQQII